MTRPLLAGIIVSGIVYLVLLFVLIDTVTHGWTFLGASK